MANPASPILALEGRAAADQKQIGALQQRVSFLEDQFRLAQLKRFAPSSEKLGAQGCLFNEAEQYAAAFPESEATDEEDTPRSPPKKRGRRALPTHLPRKRVEHDLPEVEKVCVCCQGTLHALYADKRNLTLLGDPAELTALGVAPALQAILRRAIPETERVRPARPSAFGLSGADCFSSLQPGMAAARPTAATK